ncbi:LacI family DNA-binding transcriptional regulator [Paenibacillus sp. G2S3]|uniref:LacI family DNA-binding transcriptional regulator n=1 Tax=Paenibacillus sp. G2S3 TaxID=3047872 RepID=UPI0024C122B0|nr:LacI family DNA-binding transcriptional regulator [Paenibacillus sp. G2S3]WHY18679.1 LacI family DNA-binding transcriptional regulator [Paenibacillus sp. G2S3]
MKVTISDIAKAANVAKSTVSKVLNDSPKISQETKQKVREIMKQMNYTPSSIATGLARQSSCNIGLLVDMSKESEFLNQFFYNIIGGIESVIAPLKYELTISNVQHSSPEGHFLNRLVFSKRVDGIIANNSVLTEELSEELNQLGFPYISIGEIMAPGSWVDFDNEAGGNMLTAHLVEQGYSKIAFIGGQQQEKIYTHRQGGFLRALQQADLTVPQQWIINCKADEHDSYHAALELLQREERPDSVVCMNSYVAFGVLQAAKALGIDVPSELGIAAFDEYPLSRYTTPPLTSLNIDTFKLGVSSGQLLMERIRSNDMPLKHLLLEPELIPRESTMRTKFSGGTS